MKIKKLICIMVAVIMAMGIVTACGSDNSKSRSQTTGNTTQTTKSTVSEVTTTVQGNKDETAVGNEKEQQTQETAVQADNTKTETAQKTLVVYYSATGSTKAVAETIAQTADADIFELVPAQAYTSDDLNYNNSNSRVSKEHDNESLRNIELVKTTPDNWSSYDTVYIGYPIWWGIAAWPVNNFIKNNDFTGKTVIPFCTSVSSSMGDSGRLLQNMAGTGNWQEGKRFQSGTSAQEVQKWVSSLK